MKITISEVGKSKVLFVNEIPQSAWPLPPQGYWQHLLPENCPKNVLMLGVGAGTIARLLLEKCPNVKITGVDNSPQVIEIAKQEFDLRSIKMKLVIDDGFKYIHKIKNTFDLIIVDMYDGYHFPFEVLTQSFIERCKELLIEDGWLYINTPNTDFAAQILLPGGFKKDIGTNIIYSLQKKYNKN